MRFYDSIMSLKAKIATSLLVLLNMEINVPKKIGRREVWT